VPVALALALPTIFSGKTAGLGFSFFFSVC
jgi:hypothetical protein